MGRHSKRSVTSMFSGAIAVHEGETISQLREQIEHLKSKNNNAFEVPVKNITPLKLPGEMKQPRLYFDPLKMERLKDSIGKHGVLEPILLRPGIDENFEIISGERRWRCCQALEIDTIPSVIRQMSDSVALEAALIAHLLNEEISSIEQTESILSLLTLRLELSVSEVKESLYRIKNSNTRGKTENSRIFTSEQLDLVKDILGEFGMKLSSFVSNRLPMLNLDPTVLDSVRKGLLSPTNAVLINRQPQKLHKTLISEAEGLTKAELLSLIRTKAKPVDKNPKDSNLSQQLHERFKAVQKKPSVLSSPKVQSKLKKIDALLREIEVLCE